MPLWIGGRALALSCRWARQKWWRAPTVPCVSARDSMMILERGDSGEYPEGRRERGNLQRQIWEPVVMRA